MRISLANRPDGSAVLRCERDDGSVSWQRTDGRQAAFFPLHDLTHLAVEATLGVREGFFGLIAAGWEIGDTSGKGARGALPPEAILVEHIVGLLDRERGAGVRWTAAEFNEQLVEPFARASVGGRGMLTDDDLDRVRAKRGELFARWRNTAAGDSLELEFGLAGLIAGPRQ